jgi:hypothetical protein
LWETVIPAAVPVILFDMCQQIERGARHIENAVARRQRGSELRGVDADIRAGDPWIAGKWRDISEAVCIRRVGVHEVAGEHETVIAAPQIDEATEIEIVEDVAEALFHRNGRTHPVGRDVPLQARRPHIGGNLKRP